MFKPTQGVITYDKLGLSEINETQFYSKLSVVLQDIYLFSGTIRENIIMGRDNIDDEVLRRTIECSGVNDFLPRIPGGLECVLSDRGQSLSAGQRQSIALARALVIEPEVLLLDEPFAGVDLLSIQDIKGLFIKLQNRGCAVLVTDHNASQLLSVVDRAYVIANGSIVANGTPREIVNTAEARKLYFGTDFTL